MADSPNGAIVRDYRPGDAGAFRRLNEEWLEKHFRVEPMDVRILGDPGTHVLSPGGAILIAEVAGQPVGCCALVPLPDKPATLELAKMAVTEAHQGKGLGQLLLRAAIDRARAMGARHLYLESNSKLTAALAVYRKLGFVDTPPVHATAYSRVDVYMTLDL